MELDNQGNPVDLNVVVTEWMSAEEAAAELGITRSGVTYLCREGRLRAYQVAGMTWRIEPGSVRNHETGKPGRKPKE